MLAKPWIISSYRRCVTGTPASSRRVTYTVAPSRNRVEPTGQDRCGREAVESAGPERRGVGVLAAELVCQVVVPEPLHVRSGEKVPLGVLLVRRRVERVVGGWIDEHLVRDIGPAAVARDLGDGGSIGFQKLVAHSRLRVALDRGDKQLAKNALQTINKLQTNSQLRDGEWDRLSETDRKSVV